MKRITIKFLNHHNACDETKEWFNSLKQDSYSVSHLVKLLFKEDRFDWINWGIIRLMNKKQQVAYTIFAAEQVIELFTDKYPNDNRPQEAINAAKKYLSNPCKKTKEAASVITKASDAAVTRAAYDAGAAYYAACAARAAAYAVNAVSATGAALCGCIGSVKTKRTLQRKIINYGLKLIT